MLLQLWMDKSSFLEPGEGFVKIFLYRATSSVNEVICIWKSAKCVGLGPKNNVCNLHEQFDNHEIMVIETFGALNNLVLSKYRSTEVNPRKRKNNFGYSLGQKRVLIWSGSGKCLVWGENRDTFLQSWYLTTTLIKMGLYFVPPGMKLHSKSSLAVSFICNSHSLCSWLNSS